MSCDFLNRTYGNKLLAIDEYVVTESEFVKVNRCCVRGA